MSKAELKLAYLNTVYSVFLGTGKYNITIGKSAPGEICKILKTTNVKTGYVLTACNPKSQKSTAEENKIRNSELKAELVDLECMVIEAMGAGHDQAWAAEESFFILGIDENQVERLAIKYGQNAYVKVAGDSPARLIFSAIWNE